MRLIQEMNVEFVNALNAAESECAELRRMLEEEQKLVQRLEQEKEDEVQMANRNIERMSQQLSEAQKDVEFATVRTDVAENEWIKVKRELQEAQVHVQLLKLENEETRQSTLKQVEEKELELANALNAAAIAKSECDKLRTMLEEEQKLEKHDEAQLDKRRIEEISRELVEAQKNAKYETTRANLAEDATKKALEQSEERVRLLEEELAKSRKEISLLKSECSNWSARTSFVSRRLSSLMRESDENQASEEAGVAEGIIQEENIQPLKRELEQGRKQRLQLEKDDGLQIAKIKAERLRQQLANTRKSVEYAESGWVKALRELKKERELVRLLKMECEEIRQSSMRQVEKKEQELANTLNATAAAEAKLSDLEREVNSLDYKACAICLTNEKNMAFGCEHMACKDCMLIISNGHICRQPIMSRLRLFLG